MLGTSSASLPVSSVKDAHCLLCRGKCREIEDRGGDKKRVSRHAASLLQRFRHRKVLRRLFGAGLQLHFCRVARKWDFCD
ncbi:hypothetical protein ACLOJK_000466 [Asimina triloba]